MITGVVVGSIGAARYAPKAAFLNVRSFFAQFSQLIRHLQ